MAINWFECPKCGETFRTKADAPAHCEGVPAVKLLVAPEAKFMEKVDPDKNKSRMVDQEKVLKERARNHSRDVDTPDLIAMNPSTEAVKNKWVREDGRMRKRIDDL